MFAYLLLERTTAPRMLYNIIDLQIILLLVLTWKHFNKLIANEKEPSYLRKLSREKNGTCDGLTLVEAIITHHSNHFKSYLNLSNHSTFRFTLELFVDWNECIPSPTSQHLNSFFRSEYSNANKMATSSMIGWIIEIILKNWKNCYRD